MTRRIARGLPASRPNGLPSNREPAISTEDTHPIPEAHPPRLPRNQKTTTNIIYICKLTPYSTHFPPNVFREPLHPKHRTAHPAREINFPVLRKDNAAPTARTNFEKPGSLLHINSCIFIYDVSLRYLSQLGHKWLKQASNLFATTPKILLKVELSRKKIIPECCF